MRVLPLVGTMLYSVLDAQLSSCSPRTSKGTQSLIYRSVIHLLTRGYYVYENRYRTLY